MPKTGNTGQRDMNALPRRRPTPADDTPADGESFLSRHRAGLGGLLVVAAAVAAGWAIWSQVGDRVRAESAYTLRPEAIELRGAAPWVPVGLKAEAIRNASLDIPLPLDDPELPRRLARAFDMHPWVKRVVGVELRNPPGAIVEILCREPVAMVGVQGGLMAVDAEGVVLPSADFTAEEAARYPRISGVSSAPQGPEGSSWGDPVVEEGAALAAAIGPEWRSLGLVACRPVAERGARMWELVGPGGLTILFGSAPGRETPGEPTAALKIAGLEGAVKAATTNERIDLTAARPAGSALPATIPSP
jgi:hypothetical protein